MATNKDAVRAGQIYDQIIGNPRDDNRKIIKARRDNKAKRHVASRMISRAKNARKRVAVAEKAIQRHSSENVL